MSKGGYQILDFKNYVFPNDEDVVVPGIYNAVKNTTKPFLLSGIKVNIIPQGEVAIRDFFDKPTNITSKGYVGFAPMDVIRDGQKMHITVRDDDTVLIQYNEEE